MASANFLNIASLLASGSVNYGSGTYKALLVSAVPTTSNLQTWANRSDVTTEVTGTGYTAGGVTVTASVGSLDTTNNRLPITWSATNPVLTSSTVSAVGAIIYKSTGTSTTDSLLHYVDFGSTVASSNGNFNLSFTTPTYINT